jgi:hypothetical protein
MRDDVPMSAAGQNDRGSSTPRDDQGVLANLPRTRPQRSSRRRAAAREATNEAAAPAGDGDRSEIAQPKRKTAKAPTPKAKAPAARGGRTAERSKDSARGKDSVPRQGFDSERDAASGSVQPPGAPELLASAAEIVGELAKAGLSAGERVLKDLLDRLPRP